MFSILHISDLHRSTQEPLANDSLLAALLADRNRYTVETPIIPPPTAIVVSGDLILGAQIGAPNWRTSIAEQYEVAEAFLSELCDRFLDGDRSGLVLVPGNHDVCWNTSRSAMKRVPPDDYPTDIYSALLEPDSLYRWSWKDLALFRISDMTFYGQRMASYWNFIATFYENVNLPTSIDPTRGFQFFELYNRRVLVAAFDSVAGNDCFDKSGAIPRGAVGKCAMSLLDSERSYDLKIAIWHHSIQGPPSHSDYMDVSQIHELIGHGFQLGLHGHQHFSATLNQLVHVDHTHSMAIVSAGSLCAGARELPRGANRQYNLIVVEDDFLNARVHVREMGEGDQFTRKCNGPFLEGFAQVSWQPQTDVMERPIEVSRKNMQRATRLAEKALHDGKPKDAVKALEEVQFMDEPFARKLMIDAVSALRDWTKMHIILQNPGTVGEIVLLIFSLMEANKLDEAQGQLDIATQVDDTTRSDLQAQINIKRALRQS